ncbi:HAMP domain-containing histidine kinase [Bizionia gelidisalsuginis]|uniref:histidine kinase n=2 Tax=Bizionia TaxID=283785 RepID=A0A8H2LBM3_9FLAO|nr:MULTISPECIES: HAMP domain-containing sensor histidine kinase [Bizionia]TYB71518.1 HAMP domain-containing histidine kinase [Bizionia saleffrena]TYC10762.1 HAMP domain-containing histidine kinase [Bizionia gelidisalsuginis]
MKTYHRLSQLSFLKKYSYKFLFVAFIGIHIPLLGIIGYVLFATSVSITGFILITLGLTLGATVITLRILNSLLDPIIKGKVALSNYVEHHIVPDLPNYYSDEIGQLLQNIQYTIECLEEVDIEKQEVTELISHDLRTPVLQSIEIIKFLEEDGHDTHHRVENLKMLKEITNKQLKFLEEMLNILRSKNVEVVLNNFEDLDLSQLIYTVIDGQNKRLADKKVSVINSFPRGIKVRGHSIALRQVFENLLDNAIKFSNNNGEIHISGTTNINSVNIKIKDDGMGFDTHTEKIMFSKFVPGHLGVNGEPSTGLGLYLTKKILNKHNGTIEPFSLGMGEGATFLISIPIA